MLMHCETTCITTYTHEWLSLAFLFILNLQSWNRIKSWLSTSIFFSFLQLNALIMHFEICWISIIVFWLEPKLTTRPSSKINHAQHLKSRLKHYVSEGKDWVLLFQLSFKPHALCWLLTTFRMLVVCSSWLILYRQT